MEFFLVLIGIAVAAMLLLAPVLALVALSRTKQIANLALRIEELSVQVRVLKEQLSRERRSMPAEAPQSREQVIPAAPLPLPPALPPRAATPEPALPAPPPRVEMTRPVTPTLAATPAKPKAPAIEWERWIGVRGAALLGGIALALAGLLFFQYSIQRGWISPAIRVAIGIATGLAALLGAEARLRPRGHVSLANSLAGAGIVILYAATWAAKVRYDLISAPPAYLLMILITTTACLLAVRRSALVIAILGLAGGFATPLLLAQHSKHPATVFAYVLLLDIGLLAVARKKGWAILGTLSVLGTALIQIAWVGKHYDSRPLVLALAVFAALFAAASSGIARGQRGAWLAAQAGGVLVPFLFAVHLSARSDDSIGLMPMAALLVLLSAAGAWTGREQDASWLPGASVAAALGVLATWLLRHGFETKHAWVAAGTAVLIALIQQVFVEKDREKAVERGSSVGTLVATIGGIVVLAAASLSVDSLTLTPWACAFVALGAVVYRHDAVVARGATCSVAAALIALALSAWIVANVAAENAPGASGWMAFLTGLGVVALAACFVAKSAATRNRFTMAATVYAFVSTLALLWSPFMRDPIVAEMLGGALVLGVIAALASALVHEGAGILASAAAVALVHAWWTWKSPAARWPSSTGTALAIEAAAVLMFAAWPFLVPALRRDAWTWRAAALAGPLWLLAMKKMWVIGFTDAVIGAVPLALGAVSLAGALGAQRLLPRDTTVRLTALAWTSAAALGLIAVAIPMQLEKQWITIGWALQGLAVIVLWRRLDHPGLKWFGIALLVAVTIRLVFNGAVLGYYPRSDWRLVNWLLYTYAVPCACLVWSAVLLARHELERLRARELPFYPAGKPLGAIVCGFGAVAVGFVWTCLAVFDWFADGRTLSIPYDRMPARDVTLSTTWALYALVLLAIGMNRGIGALRWLSLCILLLAIGKVFLHDLGRLQDLYRVLSLLGLALSLIIVSFLYQRFVFGKKTAPIDPGAPPP